MYRDIRKIGLSSLAVIVALLFTACPSPQPAASNGTGTAWGPGAFRSNGERIYFTATSDRGTAITFTGDPASSSGMMMGGRFACASCHGPDGRGGEHNMGGNDMGGNNMGAMRTMTAKDIR